MSEIDLLSLVSRWIHILFAVILAGGTLFLRFVYTPSRAAGEEIAETIRTRWAKIVMAASGLLLLSGTYNTIYVFMTFKLEPLYHGALGLKILLSLAIFMLSAMLAGRTELAQKLRQKQDLWLNVNCFLIVVLICVAGVLKAIPHSPKPDKDESAAQARRPAAVHLVTSKPSTTQELYG